MAPLFYINANINGALWLKDDANLNMLHFQKFIYGVERQNISVLFFFHFFRHYILHLYVQRLQSAPTSLVYMK